MGLEVYTAAGALKVDQATHPNVQVFTSDGTWTKPDGATYVEVTAIGAGGGGGSGRRAAEGGNRGGGSGGGGGMYVKAAFPASALGATEAVVVGVGGAGGTTNAVNDSAGNIGTDGEDSTFGDEPWVRADGGNAGEAGTTGTVSGGAGGEETTTNRTFADQVYLGGEGGSGQSTAAGSNATDLPTIPGLQNWLTAGAGGGGGGGGRDNTNTNFNGGDGGHSWDKSGGTNAVPTATLAVAGESSPAGLPQTGAGGGGGSGVSGANTSGPGADGGLYGGGGGGGGGKSNAGANNAGGVGADGIVMVVSW